MSILGIVALTSAKSFKFSDGESQTGCCKIAPPQPSNSKRMERMGTRWSERDARRGRKENKENKEGQKCPKKGGVL